MRRAPVIICFITLLAGCRSSDSLEFISKNNYGGYYFSYDEETLDIDSLIYVSSKGVTYKMDYEPLRLSNPVVYKAFISFVDNGNLVLLEPGKQQKDFIPLSGNFLNSSLVYGFDNYIIVLDFDKMNVLDVNTKKVVFAYTGALQNAFVKENEVYYVIEQRSGNTLASVLMRNNLNTGSTEVVCSFDEMIMNKGDATTEGWNGMALINNVLFLNGRSNLLAIDPDTGSLYDKIPEEHRLKLKFSDKKKVVFDYQKGTINFSFTNNKFRRN